MGVTVNIESLSDEEWDEFPNAHWTYTSWSDVLRCFFGDNDARIDDGFVMWGSLSPEHILQAADTGLANAYAVGDRRLVERVLYTIHIADVAKRLDRKVGWA